MAARTSIFTGVYHMTQATGQGLQAMLAQVFLGVLNIQH
jgi:hypothetical protein